MPLQQTRRGDFVNLWFYLGWPAFIVFHNATFFGSGIICILHTGCAKM
jgi:hypothetical protein